MNKRKFIKVLGAAMVSPAVAPLLGWGAGEKLKNWAGNIEYSTEDLYAAATVALPSLQLSALRLAVAMAVSSGATSLEAAALVSEADAPDAADLAAVADLGAGATVFHAATDGSVRAALTP